MKQHQRQVAIFVTRMRKLSKSEGISTIEKSIATFAHQCMNFNLQVFRNLKTPEFNAIADYILLYDNKKAISQNFQNDGMSEVHLPQMIREYMSDAEIHQNICDIFGKIIYK